jgi:hemolysin III
MTEPSSAIARHQSLGEEIANSLTHAAGLVAAVVGTPFLVAGALAAGGTGFIAGAAIFCATTIVLYLASTLYHALPRGRLKRVFNVIDHSAIFLLIAGTYTPFTLGVLSGTAGWILFGLVWSVAVLGMLLKAIGRVRHPVLSTGLYLVMGWLALIALEPLITHIPLPGILWLLGGGLCYTLGVVFYVTDHRLPYGHAIWHAFVLGGTACHYFAVLWYGA